VGVLSSGAISLQTKVQWLSRIDLLLRLKLVNLAATATQAKLPMLLEFTMMLELAILLQLFTQMGNEFLLPQMANEVASKVPLA
jgi:anaerobic C4-dicarboxylate transporter